MFRNNTAWPLTIRAGHTPTSVTVQLWGDNEGRQVTTATIGDVSSSEGGTATVYRTIVSSSGSIVNESWTHTYRMPIPE